NSRAPGVGLGRAPNGDVTGPATGSVSAPDPVAAWKIWAPAGPAGAAVAPAGAAVEAPAVASGLSPSARARAASNPAPAGERIPTVAQRASMRLMESMMPAMVPPQTPVGQDRKSVV